MPAPRTVAGGGPGDRAGRGLPLRVVDSAELDDTVRVGRTVRVTAGKITVVPPRGPETPSERVARALRERIEAGEWAKDDALPATARLATEYGVSQSTVTRALRVLVAEGLIVTRPGWGVFRA